MLPMLAVSASHGQRSGLDLGGWSVCCAAMIFSLESRADKLLRLPCDKTGVYPLQVLSRPVLLRSRTAESASSTGALAGK